MSSASYLFVTCDKNLEHDGSGIWMKGYENKKNSFYNLDYINIGKTKSFIYHQLEVTFQKCIIRYLSCS